MHETYLQSSTKDLHDDEVVELVDVSKVSHAQKTHEDTTTWEVGNSTLHTHSYCISTYKPWDRLTYFTLRGGGGGGGHTFINTAQY